MKKTLITAFICVIFTSFTPKQPKDIRYYNLLIEFNNQQKMTDWYLLMVNYTDSTFFYYHFSPMTPNYVTGKVWKNTDGTLIFQSKYLSHKIPMDIKVVDNSNLGENVLSFTRAESARFIAGAALGITINDSVNYECDFKDSIIIKGQINSIQISVENQNFIFEKKYLNCNNCRIYCNIDVLQDYFSYKDFDNVQGFYQNQNKRKLLALTPFKFYPSEPDTAYFQETTKRKALKWLKKTAFGPAINDYVERCINPTMQ